MEVVEKEGVAYDPEGLEAILFTADGDMRQALNNLQSTYSGFGFISAENVFKVDWAAVTTLTCCRYVINLTLWW